MEHLIKREPEKCPPHKRQLVLPCEMVVKVLWLKVFTMGCIAVHFNGKSNAGGTFNGKIYTSSPYFCAAEPNRIIKIKGILSAEKIFRDNF